MPLTLTFHGAAGTVTGSRFLIRDGRHRVLVDCGLFQGLRELREMNWEAPRFDPKQLDAVVLTHAHIDHSGYLPRLVREGFRGPVYCTPATGELAEILLLDAARLQEEDAEHANRTGYSRHRPALALFTEDDARRALGHLRLVPFGKPLDLPPFRVRFLPAGHILGSAFVQFEWRHGLGSRSITFSGDLGPSGAPLHADPSPLPECETLVLESTYGDRLHDRSSLGRQLLHAIAGTLRRGGIVLVPAFAVARAQIVTLVLRELIDSGQMREVPIDIDSPMATDVTEVYARHAGSRELDQPVSRTALLPRQVRFHRTGQESRVLNDLPGPRIIVSASGMLAGGRVLHHLRRLAPDPRNLILLVGYQAAGTRGRALQEGARSLRVHGDDVPINAEVVTLHGFSAHADSDELFRWATAGPGHPKTAFLVHGEGGAPSTLADRLRETGMATIVPAHGSSYEYLPQTGRWRAIKSEASLTSGA